MKNKAGWDQFQELCMVVRLKFMISQIPKKLEKAAAENFQLIILGDANLCAVKWNDKDYKFKKIAVIG